MFSIRLSKDATIKFRYDNWDDFGYKTTFSAVLMENDKETELGYVNIGVDESLNVVDSITEYTTEEIYKNLKNEDNIVEYVPKEFFIMGNIEYYKKIWDFFRDKAILTTFYENTNDIACCDEVFQRVKNYRAVKISFFRNTSSEILKQYRRIAFGGAINVNFDWELLYLKDEKTEIRINLKNNLRSEIPTNIFALIGNNGSGKTSLLKDIAIAASKFNQSIDGVALFHSGYKMILKTNDTISENRSDLVDGITQLVFISYSSFDIFDENFVEVFKNNSNFDFVSNRNIKDIKNANTKDFNTISNPEDLAADLEEKMEWIYYDTNLTQRFSEMMRAFKWDKKLMEVTRMVEDVTSTVDENGQRNSVKREIERLSSGQKIIFSIIVNFVKSASENALFLIDEPELYLHPPYTLSLILAINSLLKETNSACIVTTHSPIVLQEIQKENTFIVENNDNKKVKKPRIETYGTDVSSINEEVFGIDIRNTGFYVTLKEIAEKKPEVAKKLLDEHRLGMDAATYLNILRRKNVKKN